jgi:GT2 family glycosyltransferase
MNKLVSVIIVNYNGEKYLEETILSLYNQTYPNIEIIVVDNNSKDGSIEILNKHLDRVKVIENKTNLGFAKGNNIGMEQSKGDYIALLNNDAVADPNWLKNIVDFMEQNPDVGSCGCKIISYYNRNIMDSAGLVISRDGMSRGRGREEPINFYNNNEEILIPSGCAALYRRIALDEVGLFDEDFFCYCEDTDLGLRLQLYGWKSFYIANSLVYHRYSSTSGKYSPFKAYLVERNHYWVVLKNYPAFFLFLNPFYTLNRYIFQLKSLIRNEGATSEFASSISKFQLISTVLKAHFDVWRSFPRSLKKRKIIQRQRSVSLREFNNWFNVYGITLENLFREGTLQVTTERQESI